MKHSLNTFNLVFFVNDLDMVETLSEHIRNIGFSVSEAVSADDIFKYIHDKSLLYIMKSEAKNSISIHKDLIKMLTSVSSRISTISIISHDLSHVKIAYNSQNNSVNYHQTLSEVEREHIINTLEKCGWRPKTAAKLLGIDRTTLYRKTKKYSIGKK